MPVSRLFFSTLLTLFSFHPFVQAKNLCSGPRVFFANGMNNDKGTAWDSAGHLREVLHNRSGELDKIRWDNRVQLVYNYDDIMPLELLQVFLQKRAESFDVIWDAIYYLTRAPDWARDIVESFRARASVLVDKANLDEQISLYEGYLNRNYSLITVAHSQGNLFTNRAFKSLSQRFEDNQMQMISVATPANFVFAGGPHLTLNSDGIINSLRLVSSVIILPPLPSNATNTFPRPGRFDHQFVRHYLKGIPSGGKILDHVVRSMTKASQGEESQVSHDEYELLLSCLPDLEALDLAVFRPEACIKMCQTLSAYMNSYDCSSACESYCNCPL